MEGCEFGLGDIAHLPVLLGRASLIEAAVRCMLTDGFEAAEGSQSSDVGGHHGRAPRFGDEGHGAKVVELVGLRLVHGVVNGVLVGKVAVEEVKVVVSHQVVDEATTRGGLGHTTDQTVDGVALLEEEFSEIGAVLSRDAGDHGRLAAHGCAWVPPFLKRSRDGSGEFPSHQHHSWVDFKEENAGFATMAQQDEREGSRPRVLVVRGSFGALGGAERELLQLLRAVEGRWEVTLATLDFPSHARELLGDATVEVLCPATNTVWPQGAWAEISAASSRLAQRRWPSLDIPWASFDAVHLSVCKGTLEILPLIPAGLSVHYHCLEPPRWLYEDVLHRRLDGRPKRPLWLTSLLFTRQRRRDQRFVKALIQRPNATISGNSMWIQRRLKAVYGLASDPMKGNGETPKRDEHARPLEATHLMHVIDLDAWPTEASAIEQEDLKNAPAPPTPYVMTVGRASHVKGTWETLRSLNGTGFGLVQVGGGDAADIAQLEREAERLGVPLVCMPRLSQAALVGLVRGAAAMVSHAHHEPFGLTPIEAMAVGTPALMVDEGGFQCTMSGIDSGKLLRRDDVEGWQSAYEDLNNGDLRSAWAKVGRPYVETHFTLPVQIDALETLLDLPAP